MSAAREAPAAPAGALSGASSASDLPSESPGPETGFGASGIFVIPILMAAPALVFAGLAGLGAIGWRPALLGALVCAGLAGGFAAMVARDLGNLSRLIRGLQAEAGRSERIRLWLPWMQAVRREALALIRAERAQGLRLKVSAAADRALLERLPDAMLRLDSTGAVNWRNASAVSAFGHDTASLLRHPELRAALAEARRTGQPLRRSMALAAPVARDLDATVIPAGGQTYLLLTDRTRERSVEKVRADFVANVSHELRTPLASLIGFIETLRGPAKDDRQARERFLEIMAEQAMRMQRVIADLLSLSRIEISEHQPPEEILDIAPLLERIVAGMEPVLQGDGAKIDLKLAPGLPVLPGDADQLTQLFTNLLDNAVKYGKRGGRIGVTALFAAADPRFEAAGLLISVADEGAGIPREHIPRLTERFYRVDKGRSRAVGGTGLGLAIVKHVVNRHRGRLLIESAEGQGTTFTVWLPLARH